MNVELHGDSRVAVKINPRIEGGGAGGKRMPIESGEKRDDFGRKYAILDENT